MSFLFKSKTEGNENSINTLDEILGYFDEIFKQRKEIEIRVRKKIFLCGIYEINEKKKILRIQDKDMALYNKDAVKCGFTLDNTWFSFNSTLMIIDNKPHINIPKEISQNERRKHKRVSFAQRENANASILESFSKGIGITGSILNISLGGICVEINRALAIENEREVTPQPNLIQSGTKLGLVRIKGITGFAELDTNGVVNEIRRGHKWKIAIELPKLSNDIKNNFERFINSRSQEFSLVRRSRKKRIEAEKKRKSEMKKMQQDKQLSNDVSTKSTNTMSVETLDKGIKKDVKNKLGQKEENKKKLIPILIVGKPLDRDLFFLRKFTNFEFFIANDVVDLIKALSEHSPELLFIPHSLKEQNLLNVLIKISQSGILADIRVFLFIDTMIPENDIIKCKKLGIESIIKLPLKDPLILIKKIGKKN